jgi:hypothetical protein
MAAEYRVNRIPVTRIIQNKVFELITAENDTGSKKKHPAKWYRAETANKLELKEEENPSLRSYEDLVTEIRSYLKKQNPLDEPWSFGSLINYPLPPDKIIEVWRLCENLRTGEPVRELPGVGGEIVLDEFYKKFKLKWLTIRQVRWYIILRSIPTGFEDDPDIDPAMKIPEIYRRLAMVQAIHYAKLEQQSELLNKSLITTDIDSDTLVEMNNNYQLIAQSMWENDKLIKRKKL